MADSIPWCAPFPSRWNAGLPLVLALLCLAPSAAPGGTWEELEEEGAAVSGIEIRTRDVFDTTDPREDHLLGRLANFIHIRSREKTVAREVLFGAGEKVRASLVRETERNLRALSYIRQGEVLPERDGSGNLRAIVVTDDAWSLRGGLKFRYEGGDSEWGVHVEETNLLGLGKTLRFGYEETAERRALQAGFKDPRFFGTRWQLGGSYEDLSDGRRRRFSLRRPFFSLATGWAAMASFFAEESSLRLYDLGDEVERIPATFDKLRLGVWKAAARGEHFVMRLGLEYRVDEALYGEPVTVKENDLPDPETGERRLGGFFLAGQFLEDRHIVAANMVSIGKTEDVNLGWDIRAAAGYYGGALGGEQEAIAVETGMARNWRPCPEMTIGAALDGEGRFQDDRWEEVLAGMKLALYDQHFPRQTLTARASLRGGSRLAPESWLYIGADDGLRGYVNNFLAGDRRWIVSLEDRLITEHVFWGLAQLGLVAFFDAGAIRRFDTGDWSRVYADVGGGLRIGNLKSAFGRVVLATMAFPLVKGEGVNDFEIFVGNEIPF